MSLPAQQTIRQGPPDRHRVEGEFMDADFKIESCAELCQTISRKGSTERRTLARVSKSIGTDVHTAWGLGEEWPEIRLTRPQIESAC